MNPKEGYRRLTIFLPKEHYNLLVQRKLLHGCSISMSVTEALERERPAAQK